MKLRDVAHIRSKNAEPWMTTCDLFFLRDEHYQLARKSGLFTKESIARIYRIPDEAVYGVFFLDTIKVIKVSIYKYGKNGYMGSGDPGSADHYGTQQHIPLSELELAGEPLADA